MRFLKLSAILIGAAAVIASLAVLPKRVCFKGGDNYSFYCGTSSADCRVISADSPALRKLTLKNLCGESAVYPPRDPFELIAEFDGEIVFSEEIAGVTNYYCRASLPYSVNVDGEEINLHVCVREDSVMAGTPIIFGGY